MRIGIDASCWWSRRGFGRFTRDLLSAMFEAADEHQFVLFTDRPPAPEMLQPNVELIRVSISQPVTEAAVVRGNRALRDIWSFTRAVAGQSLDVLFYPAVYSWFPAPVKLATVVTLHDAIAERFPKLVFPDARGRLLWSLKMRLARWQARRIMTVSNAAEKEIIKYLNIKSEHIDIISEAASLIFKPLLDHECRAGARLRAGLPANVRLILSVGGLAPHKNIPGFLRGLALAMDRGGIGDVHFALIGDPEGDGFHSHYHELLALVQADPRLQARVHFPGYVTDEDLVALYSDALCLSLPSFSEGFGLPAIEAMACGIPVLASAQGAIPEVVGNAGLYFDPKEVGQIADAIEAIATQQETLERLRENALLRAGQFTWAKAAKLALASLETAAGR